VFSAECQHVVNGGFRSLFFNRCLTLCEMTRLDSASTRPLKGLGWLGSNTIRLKPSRGRDSATHPCLYPIGPPAMCTSSAMAEGKVWPQMHGKLCALALSNQGVGVSVCRAQGSARSLCQLCINLPPLVQSAALSFPFPIPSACVDQRYLLVLEEAVNQTQTHRR